MNLLKKLSFIVIVLFALYLSGQSQEIKVSGIVLSKTDSLPVQYAHITNVTRQRFVTTRDSGEFMIYANYNDVIHITAIGFHVYRFEADSSLDFSLPLVFLLAPAEYGLDTITITPLPPRELFGKAFLSLQLEDDKPDLHIIPENLNEIEYPTDARSVRTRYPNEGGLGVNVPLGKIFKGMRPDKISDERKAENEARAIWEEIERKYGNEIVGRLTGLKEEQEIVEFKKFCNLSNDYILNHKEYDVALAVMDCYKEYESKSK